MCGIHVIIDKQNRLDDSFVRRMAAATAHRGPDATQWQAIRTARQTVWLAHNRLKINDLRDEANQPMTSPDGRHTLVFNGAIYNDAQLRQSLSREAGFRTQTDTETVLYLLARHGAAGLTQLNGMFALASYDRQTETLLLARDRWGMKPLYWFENERFAIVSSEIRGILASGLVEKKPNLAQIPHYLAFKFARRPATFYQDIQELEPGSIAELRPRGKFVETGRLERRGLSLTGDTIPRKPDLSVDALEHALEHATLRHLQADVPAGILLSGGVDSTLLLASAHQAGIRRLPAFTIAYQSPDAPHATRDQTYARAAAKQYDADLQEVTIGSQLLGRFPEWLQTIDQPVADGAAWLTWLLAQEAKKSVSVLLSGAGADELFAGYHRHWAFGQYLRFHPLLKNSIFLLRQTSSLLPEQNNYGRLWRKAAAQLSASPEETFIRFTAQQASFKFNSPAYQTKDPTFGFLDESLGFAEKYLSAALRFDQDRYLVSDVLAITDRMTMQHGVEARLPYLDDSITALAQSVPATFLLRHGRKWLLKKILSRRNGKPYVQRPKEGFGMPFGHWLRTPAGKPMVEMLQNKHAMVYETVAYAHTMQLLAQHLQGRANHASELWSLVVLTAWLEKEF